jgi:hypothetical protein
MADTNRLFRPDAEGALRDPRSNSQVNGNMVNPPRYAQLGGLTDASKAFGRNEMRVVAPGSTQRRVPAYNKRGD